MPQAVPADLAPRLMRLHGHPFVWWISQFVSYLFRLQPWVVTSIEQMQQKLGFQRPIVGSVELQNCWNRKLQEYDWKLSRLRNDLYRVEWDVKLYCTIPYHWKLWQMDIRMIIHRYSCGQCFDAIAWATGRASSLWKKKLCNNSHIFLHQAIGYNQEWFQKISRRYQ